MAPAVLIAVDARTGPAKAVPGRAGRNDFLVCRLLKQSVRRRADRAEAARGGGGGGARARCSGPGLAGAGRLAADPPVIPLPATHCAVCGRLCGAELCSALAARRAFTHSAPR